MDSPNNRKNTKTDKNPQRSFVIQTNVNGSLTQPVFEYITIDNKLDESDSNNEKYTGKLIDKNWKYLYNINGLIIRSSEK